MDSGPSEPSEPSADGLNPGRATRRERIGASIARLADAIRRSDDAAVEQAVLQLSRRRRWLAPLGMIVGAFLMLFQGVKLLFTNWRLTLVQIVPAMWIWIAMLDIKLHVLHGRQFHVLRGPILIPCVLGVTALAAGCGTAFATMSEKLTARQLSTVERSFGIGTPWNLRVPAFSGSAAAVTGQAGVAAQVTGTGGVLMSPLGMATVAAEVAAGTGHAPEILPTDSSATWQTPLTSTELDQLRQLMRLAVTSGSAHAADLSGMPVYGQAGVVQSGQHSYLSWFVGYRGSLAVAVLETGTTADQAAAALAGTFLGNVG